jgi:hypothetical protein
MTTFCKLNGNCFVLLVFWLQLAKLASHLLVPLQAPSFDNFASQAATKNFPATKFGTITVQG